MRKGQCIFRIQNCKFRHNVLIRKNMADLLLCLMICDYRPGIHFRSGSYHSQHTPYRKSFAVRFFKTYIIFLPGIFFTINRNRNCFRIVADGSPANCQQKICIMVSCSFNAFIEFIHCRVGHNTGDFRYIFSILFQNFYNFIINPVFLNRPATIDQYNIFPILWQFYVQIIQRILSKIKFCRVTIRKISQHLQVLL